MKRFPVSRHYAAGGIMKFSKIVFLIAGIYGLLVVTPQYFMESLIGRKFPPPVTHPEYYYGFVGAVVIWHVLFLVISRDPARYRPMMPIAALEKLAFGAPILVLCLQHPAAFAIVGAAIIDLILGALFMISFWKTSERAVHLQS